MSSRHVIGGLVILCAFASFASAELIYEDGFDGAALNPAWTAWGSGPYSVNSGNLRFTTLPGDFVDVYQAQVGAPKHVFLVDVGPMYGEWSAIARVRYNTPTQTYQQVDVVAVDDAETNVKLSYERGGGGVWSHGLISEFNPPDDSAFVNVPQKTDYFWLRMDGDRITNTYTGFYSNDTTTDPALVAWTMTGQVTNPYDIARVGIGGWNALASSGQLAEFDYFRVTGIVPEPAALALLGVLGLVARRR